jgi:hypothetical protein
MRYEVEEFGDRADMYLAPSFNNVEKTAENVRKTGLFENVYY